MKRPSSTAKEAKSLKPLREFLVPPALRKALEISNVDPADLTWYGEPFNFDNLSRVATVGFWKLELLEAHGQLLFLAQGGGCGACAWTSRQWSLRDAIDYCERALQPRKAEMEAALAARPDSTSSCLGRSPQLPQQPPGSVCELELALGVGLFGCS